MNTNKILPVAALAVLLGLSGAMIATAQNLEDAATTEATTTDAPIQVRHARDGDHHGGRGERGGRMGGEMFRALFTQADADADGSVTPEELAALRTAKVAIGDTNADGALTLAEFQAVWADLMQQKTVDAFQHVDADGDGTITPVELDTLQTNALERMDRNGDGVLNADDRGHGDRG